MKKKYKGNVSELKIHIFAHLFCNTSYFSTVYTVSLVVNKK